jgi:hypothetical protein
VRLNAIRDRWRDASLTALLVVQVIIIFAFAPAVASGLPVPRGALVLLLLVFMSLTIFMARGRWTLLAGLGTLAASAVAGVAEGRYPDLRVRLLGEGLTIVTFAVLCVVVFSAAFGPGRFTAHRIRGAVVLYLNLGLLFALLHRVVAELAPGAYLHLPDPSHPAAFRAALDYFSFATLTSVGYGDIVPLHPFARSLATLEGVVGQLYPPTLLARVVMLELASREA